MECSIKDDNNDQLKVIINQEEDTYTVGPYTILFTGYDAELNGGGYADLGELVWDEIVNRRGYKDQFISGTIDATIKFQDGSNKNAYVEVLDEGGKIIEEGFPHFGKEFYIRYKSDKNGPIVDFIKPKVQINYLKKFIEVGCQIWNPYHMTYLMLQDRAQLFKKAIEEIGSKYSSLKNPTSRGNGETLLSYYFDNETIYETLEGNGDDRRKCL